MFLSYFNLAKQPFGATPDPRFLFQSASHREALASLYCGFYANRGFTALIAEPGMGKTTLLLEFLGHIRERARTVFLSNSLFESDDLLSFILLDLGISPSQDIPNKHRQLNEIVLSEARARGRLVLVIDEAQNLSVRALEAVRLLTNFETPRSKLIQIVLAGQLQLADTLAKPEVAQLLQRVSTVCRLEPLSPAEVAAYIEHRLKIAGYTGKQLFTSGAIQLITEASHGIPRIINTLCFNSLCLCRARSAKQVREFMVAEAISDLQLPSHRGDISGPQASIEMPPPSITCISEIRPSRSKSAWYIAAALAGIFTALAGVHFWMLRENAISASPSPAVVTSALREAGSKLPISGTHASEPVRATGNDMDGVARTVKGAAFQSDNPPQLPIVKIAPGDTLETIATQHLGAFSPIILRQIQALNPQLTDPNHIESGRTLRLPRRGGLEDPDTLTRTKP